MFPLGAFSSKELSFRIGFLKGLSPQNQSFANIWKVRFRGRKSILNFWNSPSICRHFCQNGRTRFFIPIEICLRRSVKGIFEVWKSGKFKEGLTSSRRILKICWLALFVLQILPGTRRAWPNRRSGKCFRRWGCTFNWMCREGFICLLEWQVVMHQPSVLQAKRSSAGAYKSLKFKPFWIVTNILRSTFDAQFDLNASPEFL